MPLGSDIISNPSRSNRTSPDRNLPLFVEALQKAGGEVYEVGGTIRDRLMGRPEPKDRDLLVTKLPLEALSKALRPFGELFAVGKSFGVIKFYPREEAVAYDIALPRKEVSTGVGHRDFEVDYDPAIPVEIDLSRRDFTINAMARNLATHTLIDPFGGKKDLEKKTLRVVSFQAFREDPLRILRGIQFSARFDLTIDPTTLDEMKKAAPLVKTVSAERIAEEVRKLFLAERPSKGFILMEQIGLLPDLFPELAENVGVEQGNKFRNDDVFMHTMRVLDASRKDSAIVMAGDLELMLAALFHDVGKARTKRFSPKKNRLTFYGHQTISKRLAAKRLAALKITTLGVNPENILRLVEEHMFQTKSYFSERSIRRFINKIGPELILKLVDLRLADNRGGKYPEGIHGVLKLRKKIAEELDRKSPFSAKDLAISGHDIMALGVPEGPKIGQILQELVEVVLDEPERNTKEELLKVVQEKL